jgi:hypothetical protein
MYSKVWNNIHFEEKKINSAEIGHILAPLDFGAAAGMRSRGRYSKGRWPK